MRGLVVFDLDGTLVDSRQDLAEATNDVLAELGAPPLPVAVVTRMVGDGARMLVARALEAAGVEADVDVALAAFHRTYAGRLTATTRPYVGIPELLESLAATTTLAVLTNKPLAPTQRLLDAFGWTSHFAGVIGGDGPFVRKPDPAGLVSLMSQAGASPAHTVMVGDSMADVEVARRAGVRMCFAEYGFGAARGDVRLTGTERVAGSAAELLRLLTEEW